MKVQRVHDREEYEKYFPTKYRTALKSKDLVVPCGFYKKERTAIVIKDGDAVKFLCPLFANITELNDEKVDDIMSWIPSDIFLVDVLSGQILYDIENDFVYGNFTDTPAGVSGEYLIFSGDGTHRFAATSYQSVVQELFLLNKMFPICRTDIKYDAVRALAKHLEKSIGYEGVNLYAVEASTHPFDESALTNVINTEERILSYPQAGRAKFNKALSLGVLGRTRQDAKRSVYVSAIIGDAFFAKDPEYNAEIILTESTDSRILEMCIEKGQIFVQVDGDISVTEVANYLRIPEDLIILEGTR